MKASASFLAVLFIGLLTLESTVASETRWSTKMQSLYKALSELLTDVTSDSQFNNLKNKKRIENEASALANLAHDLDTNEVSSPDRDPTIQIVARMLARESKRAANALKSGNRVYARSVLRSLPSYCIACHTRNASGPQLKSLPFEPSNNTLTQLERGEFYTATRQFDRAQNEFKKMIQNPNTEKVNTWDWERAVRQSLAIAIRVKKDPSQAMAITETILASPQAPSFMNSCKTRQMESTRLKLFYLRAFPMKS